jgi:hypothetical protein
VRSTKSFETPISRPHLVGQLHLHRRPAEGLDLLPLTSVAVDAADREPLHVGLEQFLEHGVEPLGPDDGDNEFHERPPVRVILAQGQTRGT